MKSSLSDDTTFSKENHRKKFSRSEDDAKKSLDERQNEAPTEPPRLVTLTYKELIEKQIPPRQFVLKPWLPEAAISMVYAPPGVGKSYLCLSAAAAIASGGTLFKTSPWVAPKPRKVLYIDGEMHESDLQTRVIKLLHEIGKNIPDDYLRYFNGSWQSGFIPDLSSAEGQAQIEEVIKDQGTEVLFLDNLTLYVVLVEKMKPIAGSKCSHGYSSSAGEELLWY